MPIKHLKNLSRMTRPQPSGRFLGYNREIHGGARRGRRRPKPFWTYLLIILASLIMAGGIGVVALFAWVSRDLPDPDNIVLRNVAETTKIFDRTGQNILYQVHGDEKRTVVNMDQISVFAKNATVAIEDKDFFRHSGYDIRGILRAVYKNTINRSRSQGGSTITQQFIKNSILTREKTYIRKLKEVILAIEMERRFTKDQILKLYLNEIPYGSMAFGIESAAQTYFGKTAADLTSGEAALLASIPNAPTYYSPYGKHLDELEARRKRVVDAMVDQGYLSRDDGEAAKADEVMKRIKPRAEPILAPHFVFYVRDLLDDKIGEEEINSGGLHIVTTLNLEKQELAEKIIADNADLLKKWGANTAAMLSLDPKTGEILAMVGSADYFDEEINGKVNALTTRLQPGSSIKPMVYAAAFEKGYTPDTVLYDVETTFKNYPEDYIPHDYDENERGPVTVREALAGSLNIPAVAMLYLTGIDRFSEFAKRLGYTTYDDKSRVGLSLVLGGADVRPIEHIAAFAAFARDGLLAPSQAILRVEDRNGQVLYDAADQPAPKKVMEPEIARQINNILSDNAARAYIFGEKNYLTLSNRPAAVKTGTTNSYKDAWTIGYTPSLVTGLWVGIQQGGKMKPGADGSKVAAPIWNQFMTKALTGTPVEEFAAAQPVVTGKPVLDGDKNARVTVKIDKISGRLATEFTPPELTEERSYGTPHSILFFCDKDDPRAAAPAEPNKDPMYENFEAAVAKWIKDKEIFGSAPPTEYDDVHVLENVPTMSFVWPLEGVTLPDRTFSPQLLTSSRRGIVKTEFLMDDEPFAVVTVGNTMTITVPNRFLKGFHRLTARVFDDVGNRAESSVTVNLTAAAGPLSLRWMSPVSGQFLYAGDFPYRLRFEIGDPKSISRLLVAAVKTGDVIEERIGSIENPALPNMSLEWLNPASGGDYTLLLQATLTSGEILTERLQVKVVR